MTWDNRREAEHKESQAAWVERWPLGVRKKIWFYGTAGLMLIIVVFWFSTLKLTLSQVAKNATDQDWHEIKNEFSSLASTTQKNFGLIQEQLQAAGSQTATSSLTASDLEALTQKIIARQTENWPVYTDAVYQFTVKYPPTLALATATPVTEGKAIVSFRSDAGRTIYWQKFSLIEEFFSRPNLKKYFSRGDYYLAVFDTLNNSTTEIMLKTLKFSE